MRVSLSALLFLSFVYVAQAVELDDLVDPKAKVEKLADGFGFGEGPAWNEEEQALYFSDLKNKTIHRWSTEDGLSLIRQTEDTFANGIVIDARGRLIFCEVGNCRVLRREADGSETVLADSVQDQPLGQPNDLWMAPDGGVYFTIPDKSRKIPRLVEEGRLMGTIVHVSADGKVTRDVGAAIEIKSPNGVVGSADGKRLYFTDAGKCRMAEIQADGSLANPSLAAPKGSDGLTLDELGNLYTTSKEGVEIFGPGAKRIGLIPFPETPANLTFGGSDGRTLFVTARTGLYAMPMKVRGDAATPDKSFTSAPSTSMQEDYRFAEFEPFLETHCYECHDDVSQKGDLNLLDLAFEPGQLDTWVQVFDRVQRGEMPPKDEPRPSAADIESFLAQLHSPLVETDKERVADLGRARVRRLNRAEFETALSDLLSIPLHVQAELPEDAKSHGFDTVGAALNMSSVQMESYLNVLDSVLDRATTLYPEPQRRTHRLTYREENGIMQVYRRGGPFHVQEDGVAFFATEKFSHLNAVMSQWTAPHTARYRVKVSAYALRSEEPVILSLRAGGTGHAESNHVPHVFLEHFPVMEGEPVVFEWEGWLERGHYFHVYPTSLPPMRFAGKNEEMRQHEYDGPAAVVQWVEVDGPIYDTWPPASHQALWGDLPTAPIPDVEPNKDPIAHLDEPPSKVAKPRMTRVSPEKQTGNKWIYSTKQEAGGEPMHRSAPIPGELRSTLALVSTTPKADSQRLLQQFASRAFRRPIAQDEVAPFVDLTHHWLDQGIPFEDAMRVGYKALLTSPGFLYHQGTLPDSSDQLAAHALAERLAFFLWNGLPDSELQELAAAGELQEPAVLRRQVDRLLSDPRSDRFIDQFLGSWLDLRLIDFTTPDEKLYPEFDKLLQWSMVEETRAFVRKLVDDDLSARNIVDSDFAMVNWRLAKHYDLPPVPGMKVQQVSLPQETVRGGILTQGSILKVTANGTTTSPVVRGVWLLERIMGEHPDPPPPGIPAIEPDIRGAVTVREQLEKHRSSTSCNSCHAKIDPPGVALESFDVIGGWRDTYRALNEDLADLKPRYSPFNSVPIQYVDGLPVDASYVMADGTSFTDIEEFKQVLLENPRQIARGITQKLVIYSTGAELSFSDRAEIESILDRAEPSGYGFRTLIHELIQSPIFHRK